MDELREKLALAHQTVFDVAPSQGRLTMAGAQVRIEGLALRGHNLGGLEAVPGKPWVGCGRGCRIRAFVSYEDAAVAYWEHLAERCRGALHAFDSRDPILVAHHLARCGYFTSTHPDPAHSTPVDVYAQRLRACMPPW